MTSHHCSASVSHALTKTAMIGRTDSSGQQINADPSRWWRVIKYNTTHHISSMLNPHLSTTCTSCEIHIINMDDSNQCMFFEQQLNASIFSPDSFRCIISNMKFDFILHVNSHLWIRTSPRFNNLPACRRATLSVWSKRGEPFTFLLHVISERMQ